MAKQSTASGLAFVEDEEVECILFRSAEGILERADLREDERADWRAPGPVFCRWTHRFKPVADSDENRQSLATAEEIFLGLIDEVKSTEGEEPGSMKRERLVFLNLITVMLERRRVLKALPNQRGRYRYMPEKRDVVVPLIDLEPTEIAGLISEIDALL